MYLRASAVILVLLCVAACQPASAQQQLRPEAAKEVSLFVVEVSGPDKIAVGDIGVFDVGKSTATKFAWTIIPSSTNFHIDSSLRKAYFTARTGTFTVVLVGTDEQGNVAIHTKTTTMGGTVIVDPPVDPVAPVDPVHQPPTTKATAVTFIYEKDQHEVPKPVLAALNKINREKKIPATILEADTTDGTGQVPDQYKIALAAAKKTGLPCLVVTAGDVVLAVVKSPKTDVQVLEAVK